MIMLLDLQQFMIFYFTTNIEKKNQWGRNIFRPHNFCHNNFRTMYDVHLRLIFMFAMILLQNYIIFVLRAK